MATELKIVEEARKPLAMHPKKFAMWLFIATVVMLFAALTSAYIVRQAEGNWMIFELPSLFYVNTAVIIVSSFTMQWAYWSARRDRLERTKLAIVITTILGITFLVGQIMAWGQMIASNVYFVGDRGSAVSGSFVYVLSGLHGFHILGGLVFLLIVLISTFRYKVHSRNITQLEMCATFWHFLGGLWIYLLLFLIWTR
ncbi:MAG TPA: cytochrome c oxidase subunit 3 [Cyclobacteriaceae bacterium]|nr:cytochrome c oxidase subunit 3 [Cyclobacteriaceae bacterium]